MTPKEVMLDNMWTFMQGAMDYQEMWRIAAGIQPPTVQAIEACRIAETEIERLRLMSGNSAFQVMGIIHPKLSAIAIAGDPGANRQTVIQDLLDEVDRRQRAEPVMIEHQPKKRIA